MSPTENLAAILAAMTDDELAFLVRIVLASHYAKLGPKCSVTLPTGYTQNGAECAMDFAIAELGALDHSRELATHLKSSPVLYVPTLGGKLDA